MILLLVLLLIQSVALADAYYLLDCPKCNEPRSHRFYGAYQYVDNQKHAQIVQCMVCNHEQLGSTMQHDESTPATCNTAAYCNACQSSYGDENPDNHPGDTKKEYSSMNDPSLHWVKTVCTYCNAVLSEKYEGHSAENYTESYYDQNEENHIHFYYCEHCHDPIPFTRPEAHTYSEATCVKAPTCICGRVNGVPDPDAHEWDGVWKDCGDGKQHYQLCARNSSHKTYAPHVQDKPATCTTPASCRECDASYGSTDPNAHDLITIDAQLPSCSATGWDVYTICQRDGCDYTSFVLRSKLVHWYAEWMPNADATHTAPCKRGCGYEHKVLCTPYTVALSHAGAEITLCPVCGKVSDGSRLALVENVDAKGETLPAGEAVVRMGALAGGDMLLSVAFELGGELMQPTGEVTITLPDTSLDGYAIYLLCEDGTELALDAVYPIVLDFDTITSPVRVLRLVPAA